MFNYRLPGNAATAIALGGSLDRQTPGNWRARNPLAVRNAFNNDYSGVPTGYRARAKIRPLKDGGIAVTIAGAATVSPVINAYGVISGSAAGTGSLTAAGFLTSQRTVTIAGAGSLAANPAGSRGNIACTIRVNALSQDDVTSAVLEAQIEGGLTLRQIMRLLAAVAAGKTDITDLGGGSATVVFRDLADTKARITASMTGSERTSVTRDVT